MSDELKARARELWARCMEEGDGCAKLSIAADIRSGTLDDCPAMNAILEALRGASGGGAGEGHSQAIRWGETMTRPLALLLTPQEDDFTKPYTDAGHDVATLFANGGGKCAHCQARLIDLSEDLAYGEMRKCSTPAAATVGAVDEYTPEALASHAIDFLDRKADGWIVETGVARMVQAAASVFEKSVPLDVLHRFNETLEALMHQAFVEGAFRAWSEIEQERTLTTERQPH